MICEKCGKEHDGSYGSGRFCCQACARSFSTSMCRDEINRKVSDTFRRKFPKKMSKHEYIQMMVEKFLNEGFVYIKYNDIDFGNMYLIDTNGTIISAYKLTTLNHNAYYNDTYKRVILTDVNKHQHAILVHRLVATTFLPNPNNYPIINHKDGNPSNNCVDNLEWCTYQYNNTYMDVHLVRGKHVSETMLKHGSWNKGLHLSEDHKRKVSDSMKTYWKKKKSSTNSV